MTRVAAEFIMAFLYRATPRGPEFLLLRRVPRAWCPGSWQCVYGKIQAGETAWQAALREIHEETGLVPLRFYQLDGVDVFYMAAQDTVHHCPCFVGEVPADAVVRMNHEHDAHQWLFAEEALRQYTWPGQRRALREIVSEIIGNGPGKAYLEIQLPPHNDADRGG